MDKDYSLYKYYKGSDEYPNDKARFFGYYEKVFENTFHGKPEERVEAFKTHMMDVLYEQCSDKCYFGMQGVDKWAKYNDYLQDYFNPERNLKKYERPE